MAKEYSSDLQKLFLEMMLQDAQSYVRVQTFITQKTLIAVSEQWQHF